MPTLRQFRPLHDGPIFVGFAGRTGSGKTSAATYLRSKFQFQYTRYSEVLQLWRACGGADRGQLQQVGWDIMSGGLQAELNSRLIASLDLSRSAAIDGLRHPADLDALSSTFGCSFGLIFVEAGPEFRFERCRERFANFDAFRVVDSHPVEGHIDSLRALAALTICNDSSQEDLYQQLDKLITSSVRGRT